MYVYIHSFSAHPLCAWQEIQARDTKLSKTWSSGRWEQGPAAVMQCDGSCDRLRYSRGRTRSRVTCEGGSCGVTLSPGCGEGAGSAVKQPKS